MRLHGVQEKLVRPMSNLFFFSNVVISTICSTASYLYPVLIYWNDVSMIVVIEDRSM